MKRSRLSTGSSMKKKKRLTGSYQLDDVSKINKMIEGKQTQGTYVIQGGVGYSGKTFNLYNVDGKFVVTNHYGMDLVNAMVFPDKKSLDKVYGSIKWEKYSMLMLPR